MQTQQTTKHEIIRNPKNDTQKTNANDNWKMCECSYDKIKLYKR